MVQLVTVQLSAEEIDELLTAMARSVSDTRTDNASEASAAVWHSEIASQTLRSLATALAEARHGLQLQEDE
jgi:hypothetical protein